MKYIHGHSIRPIEWGKYYLPNCEIKTKFLTTTEAHKSGFSSNVIFSSQKEQLLLWHDCHAIKGVVGQYLCVHRKYSKNTIRDGGSTCTDCFTLIKQYHVCQYKLLGKFKTLLEWADALLSKMLGGVEG